MAHETPDSAVSGSMAPAWRFLTVTSQFPGTDFRVMTETNADEERVSATTVAIYK